MPLRPVSIPIRLAYQIRASQVNPSHADGLATPAREAVAMNPWNRRAKTAKHHARVVSRPHSGHVPLTLPVRLYPHPWQWPRGNFGTNRQTSSVGTAPASSPLKNAP